MILESLRKKKSRISTRPTKASKEKRIDSKKKASEIKSGRRKFDTCGELNNYES